MSQVVVLGGGTSGAIAAIAAARTGAKVLLIERNSFVGGVLAFGMSIIGAVDGQGDWALGGVGRELVERLAKQGEAVGPVMTPLFSSVLAQDPEALKLELLEMLQEAGVELMLGTILVDCAVEAGRVSHVTVANKSGLQRVVAEQYVDATGDADLVARAGGRFQLGRSQDRRMQPVSRVFFVGNVDLERLFGHLEQHPEDLAPPPGWRQPARTIEESLPAEVQSVEHLRATPGAVIEGFRSLLREARDVGDVTMSRSHMALYTYPGRREVGVNLTRVSDVDGTDTDDVTAAEVETQLQMRQSVRFLRKYVPGFEECYIVSAPPLLGVRETRHVEGSYALDTADVLGGVDFEDQIGRGAYPMDLHDVSAQATTFGRSVSGNALTIMPIDRSYGIPLRSLLAVELSNVVVAGRCISATHEAAGSVRGQAVCMVTGHAAGTAAALAAVGGSDPSQLDVADLQRILRGQDAVLERGESLELASR